jgi:hypothetical protein
MAENLIPTRLYKYQAPSPTAIDNIRKRCLWFSKPKHFNDPFDCEINYRITDITDSVLQAALDELEKERLEAKAFQERFIREGNTDWKKMMELTRKLPTHVTNAEKNSDERNAALKLKAISATLRMLGESLGVSCFSEEKDSILMWSHYADKHQGFCLEFDTRFSPFRDPHKLNAVKYPEANLYPPISIMSYADSDTWPSFDYLLTIKSIHWKYEKEWRIIWQGLGDKVFSFEESALTGIYFGCRIDENTRKTIMNLLKGTSTRCYETYKSEKDFKLIFREISF